MQRKYHPTDAELQIIRENYDGTSLRLNKIMRLLPGKKYRRWHVRRLARDMGLSRSMAPDWTAAEENYVFDSYPRKGLKSLQTGLRKTLGVCRSTTAIKLKVKRLGLTADMDEGFTLRGLCDFLWGGLLQHHIIRRWIASGWLKAKRRGTLRTAKQGGDQWYFDPAWVRSFIIAHPAELDLRLVDPVAFVRLVAGDTETLCACKCPGCGVEFTRKTFNPGVHLVRVFCDDCKSGLAAVVEAESYRRAI